MTLSELLHGLDVLESTADLDTAIGDLSYDSRKTKKNDLFVAVRGFESDGHKFIGAAVKNGAVVVLCQDKPEEDIPYVLVADSRYALAIVSCNYFGNPASKMTMVGVTGTNGKTTVTMLLKHVLEECTGKTCGLIGTNHNMIGERILETERTTPESYELQKLFSEMERAGCSYVIMEVSSHALSLDRVAGVRFDVAVFTNLTQDHLDFHKTMEEYAAAKARLFSRCDKAAINIDDAYGQYMVTSARCPVISYSKENLGAALLAKDIRLSPTNVRFLALAGQAQLERIQLNIPGKFSVYNALSVISAGILLGLTLTDISRALKTASGVKGRVEVVPTPEDFTILIDYAHTPDALENVLQSMREVSSGRLVILFGCGGDRDATKRPIMGTIGTALSDFAIITSDNPRTEEPSAIIADIVGGIKQAKNKYTVIEDRVKAIHYAIDNHLPGDVIILAGKGHETYQIIGKEKHHMDEREIVADYLKELGADS